eukprot:4295302-Amphidinium_carterae.1
MLTSRFWLLRCLLTRRKLASGGPGRAMGQLARTPAAALTGVCRTLAWEPKIVPPPPPQKFPRTKR